MKPIRLYFLLTLLLLLAAGQGALAQSAFAQCTFSISDPTYNSSTQKTTFTITRSGDLSSSGTVLFRFVSLSAFSGQHFNEISGTIYFGHDVASQEIEIQEHAPSIDAYKYQNGTNQRSYRLEVLDWGGFLLASCDRTVTSGTNVPSDLFSEKEITIYTNELQYSDAGYDKNTNNPRYINSSSYYNLSGIAPSAYYTLIGAELRSTLSFDAKEQQNGYQYVQILINDINNCDNRSNPKCNDGDPGHINISRYMAGFDHQPGSANTNYAAYTFPVTSQPDDNPNPVDNAWNNGVTNKLYKQKFNTNCRATDGRLILPVDFEKLVVRFNASGGSDNDKWLAKNVKAHIQAVDGTAPTRLSDPAIPSGTVKSAKGNTFYISVPFSEIVKVTGTPTLSTTWGEFSYISGSGSNVLTFAGTITADAGTVLTVGSISGTIKDLAGNELSLNHKTINKGYSLTVAASYDYSISYNLAGGSLITANPSSYTYDAAVTIDKQPVRPGYAFAGWTGSNGNTPQTTVTIAAGSHGNRAYTANWTPLWGQDKGANGEDEDHAYVISSPAGLDMLAKVVNGTDGYTRNSFSNQFFKLGDNITYDGSVNNFTPIGNQQNTFHGTFDGKGCSVSGIHINSSNSYQGIFGYIYGGTVKNVTLQNSTIIGREDVGGIVGKMEYSSVSGCRVESTVTIGPDADFAWNHGGVAGIINNSTVTGCTSSAQVTRDKKTACIYYGGIVGLMDGSKSILQNCLVLGASIDGEDSKGAIVGYKATGTLANNYYHNCTVGGATTNVGTYDGDCDGARSVHALTLPKKVTASGESVVISGVTYYASNTTVTLNFTEGYTVSDVSYNDGTAHAITPTAGVYSFTMPAADATVSATLTTIPWSGSGTEADPWVIFYPSQLDLLAQKVNGTHGYIADSFTEKYFKLGADIAYDPNDLDANGENYTAIGTCINNTDYKFGGTFDGDGHTVSGIRINKDKRHQGLFGYIYDNGKVKNVTLTNTVITARCVAGGIVGYNQGTVENCHVESSVSILANENNQIEFGGIAGDNNGGIYGCTSSATVSDNGKTTCKVFGGIAGRSRTICYSLVLDANISAYDYYGAIAGSNNNGLYLKNNYYSSCTVNGTANASYVGYRKEGSGVGDLLEMEGAVRATAFNTKPAEIGAQIQSYPFGGVTVYEHGIYYKGIYYLCGSFNGPAMTLTLVQGTKDGVTAWWGTFYGSIPYELSTEGAAAYTMDADYQLYRLGSDGRFIHSKTPVVIVSTTTPEVTLIPLYSEPNAPDNAPGGNILIGVYADTAIPSICGLSVNNGEVGFYRIAGGILPAHRAGYKGGIQNYDKKNKQEW